MRLEASVVIDRGADEVFRVTATEHVLNHPRWDPAVSHIERLSPGPLGLGSRLRIDRRTAGRHEARVFEVTEWSPPTRFTIETRSRGFHLRLIEQCESEGDDRTRMTLVGEAEIGGLRGLLAPLVRRRQELALQANLVRIKEMVESNR
jgi:hypothetical protein